MNEILQTTRRIAITTPLGENKLLLRGFNGEEGISRLFQFKLDLFSTDSQIDFDTIVGQPATIRVSLADGSDRYFNGIISRFAQGGRDQKFTAYQAEMVPWPWLLTRTSDCFIFQNKTVKEIIEAVFKKGQFQDYSMAKLRGPFVEREYCVQYRESDFNFISRLMEEEGIYYFFVHGKGKHTMVLANSPDGHPELPKQPKVRYHYAGSGNIDQDVVSEWLTVQEVRAGAYTLNDFTFDDPTASLLAHVAGRNHFEIYDYPGEYRRLDPDGSNLARIRLEECQTPEIEAHGGSDCRAFTSGFKFELVDHYRYKGQYVLTRVHHTCSLPANVRSASMDAPQWIYRNSFECIPFATPFRPPRVTPTPVIQGSQTAIVVGKKGDEITTDKYGRVRVQFHWDRRGQHDEKSSCFIRVSEAWAGQNWGSIAIPRVGQEVIVDFLEGDPDQPIITGRVYNATHLPPYDLPANADMAGVKSNSTIGGGGYNEIVIRDKKDAELIRLHGQKDMETRVLHDQKEVVSNNKNVHVMQELRTWVEQKTSLSVKGDAAEHFEANHAEVVDAERYLKANRIVLEAGSEICIKVGGNHIHISAGGVYVQGTMVDINCGHPPANTSVSGLTPTKPDDPA